MHEMLNVSIRLWATIPKVIEEVHMGWHIAKLKMYHKTEPTQRRCVKPLPQIPIYDSVTQNTSINDDRANTKLLRAKSYRINDKWSTLNSTHNGAQCKRYKDSTKCLLVLWKMTRSLREDPYGLIGKFVLYSLNIGSIRFIEDLTYRKEGLRECATT